jgi:hypothetical protein
MKREEIVDHLVELPAGAGRVGWEEGEVARCVQAAERVRRWGEVAVPAELATRLERSLRARLHASSHPQLSNALPAENESSEILTRIRATHAPQRRTRVTVLAAAAALVLAFAGLLALAAHTLPGSAPGTLAPIAQATPTSAIDPQERVHTQLALLQNALDDLRTVAGDRRDDRALALALKTVSERTDACRTALATVPAGALRASAQTDLSGVLTQEEHLLRQLLPPLDWPLRLLFTRQLAAVGDPVPTVTHVAVQVQPDGTVLVTLSGSHFTSRTRLMLNGQPVGRVSQVTAVRLVGVLSAAQFALRAHTFGVLNPDGTAAVAREDDDAHRTGTPSPDT